MSKLQKLLELDNFFKNYELYKDFLSCRYKNEIALMEALKQLKNLEPLTEDEMKDYTKFNEIVKKIDDNNYLLEQEFANYDFSKENVADALCDYKISVYEFVKENINKHLEKKDFPNKDHFDKFIENSVTVLWNFFTTNFYVSEGFSDIFQKAIVDVSASYEGFESSSNIDNIEEHRPKSTVSSLSLKNVDSSDKLDEILENYENSLFNEE